MVIVELSDLKSYLNLEDSSDYDSILIGLEQAASDYVHDVTDRWFGESKTFEKVKNGTGTRKMWISDPADPLTSVEHRESPDQDWDTVDADDYEVDGRLLYRTDLERWVKGVRNYRITYDHGYALGGAPQNIQLAVKLLVAHRFRNRGREGLMRQRIGDYSFTRMEATQAGKQEGLSIDRLLGTASSNIWTG